MTDLRTTVRNALLADDRYLYLDPEDVDAMATAVVAALQEQVTATRWETLEPVLVSGQGVASWLGHHGMTEETARKNCRTYYPDATLVRVTTTERRETLR